MSKKYRAPANPARVAADRETRRSSAASPQESRWKRLRTDQTILDAALDEYEEEQTT